MKPQPLLRRLLSLALALLVPLASVGVRVQRHTCHFSQRSTVAVRLAGAAAATLRGCDGRPAPRPGLRRSCCDFSSQLHQLSTPAAKAAAAKMLVPAAPALLPPALRAAAWPPAAPYPWATQAPARRPAAPAPPPTGRLRLARLGCWRV